ncbi:hypothetical protein LAZ67_5003036 [Cordylochernes scorpioides]|uniref:Integrase zinc-binding domain-containing protein n=1 Tax=Cordylochernes scorpioides TaxID=51811 RepID=A0ABY6KGX1_9ARAC|nr:hypothetical protein LAZ67_5003036 [Cordylochernes scorpioides]
MCVNIVVFQFCTKPIDFLFEIVRSIKLEFRQPNSSEHSQLHNQTYPTPQSTIAFSTNIHSFNKSSPSTANSSHHIFRSTPVISRRSTPASIISHFKVVVEVCDDGYSMVDGELPSSHVCAKVKYLLETELEALKERWYKRIAFSLGVPCPCDRLCPAHQVPACPREECLHLLPLTECLARRVVECDYRRVKTDFIQKYFPEAAPNASRKCKIFAKIEFQNQLSSEMKETEIYANSPAGERYANSATSVDIVTKTPSIGAVKARKIWADILGDEDGYTAVQRNKRRRDSGEPIITRAQSNSAGTTGATRRGQPSGKWTARVQETHHPAHQDEWPWPGSSDQQILAERFIDEGLEIEGVIFRTFPFRKRTEKLTIGNLHLYVEDAVIIDVLRLYERVTSIAPKQLKAGEYGYTDGRREAYILLHDGIKIERWPTRLDIKTKGDTLPAFLTFGIRFSKCNNQGHHRANCLMLARQTIGHKQASSPSPTDVPSNGPAAHTSPRRSTAPKPAESAPPTQPEENSAPAIVAPPLPLPFSTTHELQTDPDPFELDPSGNVKENIPLDEIYDDLTAHLKNLDLLGVNTEMAGVFLYPLFESSLPLDIIQVWQTNPAVGCGIKEGTENGDKSDAGGRLQALMDYLRDEVKGAERMAFAKENIEGNSSIRATGSQLKAPRKTPPTVSNLFGSAFKRKCIFCQRDNDLSSECFVASRLTPSERDQKIKEARVCFKCIKVIHHHLNSVQGPAAEIAKTMARSFYMDNLVTSLSSQEVQQFQNTAVNIMEMAKMDLREWEFNLPVSNSKEEKETTTKVLGLVWDKVEDVLNCDVSIEKDIPRRLHKRNVLSKIQQRSWELKIGWDSQLPEDMDREFRTWYFKIGLLSEIKIPRHIWFDQINKNEIHVLCDASKSAYAAVAYMRSEVQAGVHLSLLWSKSRLAPTKRAYTTLNVETNRWFLDSRSKYSLNIRIMAWVRFLDNSRRIPTERGNLKVIELERVERKLLKLVQQETFPGKQALKNGLKTIKSVEGLWYVETKLLHRQDPEAFKRPILLPRNHSLVEQMVREIHQQNGHGGAQFILSQLREKLWIIVGRRLIKQIIGKCVICRRHNQKPI